MPQHRLDRRSFVTWLAATAALPALAACGSGTASAAPYPVSYSEAEWRELVEQAGLRVEELRVFEHAFDLDAWLERTGCTGTEAREAVRLLGDRARDGRLTLAKIAILAVSA